MSGSIATVDIRLDTGSLLAIAENTQAMNRLATALEAMNGKAAPKHSDPVPAAPRAAEPAAPATPPASAPIAKSPPIPEPPAKATVAPAEAPLRTPERVALLRREWPAGVHVRGILTRFNALPGRETDAVHLAILATALGLSRPEGFDRRHAPMTLADAVGRSKPPPAPEPLTRAEALQRVSVAAATRTAAPVVSGPIIAEFDAVAEWAGPRGIAFKSWNDLPAVNRKREELELATYARKLACHTSRGVRT